MKYSNLTLTAAAVTAALAVGTTAQAQDADTVTTENVKVTASRVEQELMDVNMSVSVITAEDIAKSDARTVGDLLKDVPGVRINNDGGQGMKRIKVRGEDTFRTLVMIDGQKIAEHKSMSGSPMLIDPAMIERIEVIKGPASVLYGSDAIGGAVNIITKKGGSKPFEAGVSAGLDNSSNGVSASAYVAGNIDGWKYRLGVAHEKGDDLRTPAGDMTKTGFKSAGVNGFLSYDIDENKTVGLTLDHFDMKFMSGSAMPGYEDFLVDVPEWKRDKVGLFADFRNLGEYLSRIRADVFYQKSTKNMLNHVAGSDMPFTVDNYADNETDQYGFSLQSDWQLGESNYLVAGYEYNRDELKATSNTISTLGRMGALMMKLPVGSLYYNNDGVYNGSMQTHALFASMETTLPADFTLNYGARYTYVKTDMDDAYSVKKYALGKNAGNPGTKTDTAGNQSDDRVIFNAGITWTGIEDLTLRALWSQGFRAPLLQERYIPTSMGSSMGMTYGNPDLDPETSDNFEIGARFIRGGLMVDTAAFLSLADDYIAAVADGPVNKRYANIAKAKTFGVELSAAYRIGLTGFEPYANVTWIRRQYDNGVGFKTYDTATPEIVARYGVRWTGSYDALALRTDLYAHSQTATKYDDGVAGSSSAYRLGGATTLNLTAGFSFGPQKQYSLDAGLYNIFDKKYQDNQSIYEPARYFSLKMNARF